MYCSYHLAAGWGPGLLEKEANASPGQWFKLKLTYCRFSSEGCLYLSRKLEHGGFNNWHWIAPKTYNIRTRLLLLVARDSGCNFIGDSGN